MLKSVLSRAPLILSNVFLYYVMTSSAASLFIVSKCPNSLHIPDGMLLWMLVHALHTHQLVAGKTKLFKFCVGMFTAQEGVEGLGIFFEAWVGIGAYATYRFFVRGN